MKTAFKIEEKFTIVVDGKASIDDKLEALVAKELPEAIKEFLKSKGYGFLPGHYFCERIAFIHGPDGAVEKLKPKGRRR